MKVSIFALLVVGGLVGCAGSPANVRDAFLGDWKLSPAKSRYTDVMQVQTGSGDSGTFDFGGGGETIVLNGSDQPGLGGTTLAVTVDGPREWKVVRKKAGHVMIAATWTLSQDGGTLADDYTEYAEDGHVSVLASYQYHRGADGQGFAGTWEGSIAVAESQAVTIQIRPYGADGLSLINPAADVTQNLRFDGKDYPVVGHGAAAGSTASAHQVDDHTLDVTSKTGGAVRKIEHIELSPDRKTLTKTARPAGQRDPNVFVFERQANG